MIPPFAQPSRAGTKSDDSIKSADGVDVNQTYPRSDVGECSHRISDAELTAHAAHCHLLAQLANARFRGSHDSQDAADAQRWSEAKDAAIKARQAAQDERRKAAEAAERLDELCFNGDWTEKIGARFDVPAAAVRRRMKG